MKKNGPGCTCCDEEIDCTQNCWFPCVGESCPEICSIVINITTPDDVDVVNEATVIDDPPSVTECIILDPMCPTSAPCLACYQLFDGSFPIFRTPVGDCNDFTVDFLLGAYSGFLFCWFPSNYSCPYDTTYPPDVLCVASELRIQDVTAQLQNTFDGSCGVTTLTIEYTIYRVECGAPPSGNAETTYTHVFENEYCTCEERLNTFTHVSTSSVNNARGITLDDPCNLQLATIKLSTDCYRCSCFECNDFDGTFLLSIAGPDFTGTIALDLSGACEAWGTFTINCPTPRQLFIKLTIVCLPCESYDLILSIYDGLQDGEEFATGTIRKYSCGDSTNFEMTYNPGPCTLDDYTFSV